MKISNIVLLTFVILGIIFSALWVHEGVHLLQAKEAYSICYDIGQNSIARVSGDFSDSDLVHNEIEAYSVEITYMIMMSILIGVLLRRNFPNEKNKEEELFKEIQVFDRRSKKGS